MIQRRSTISRAGARCAIEAAEQQAADAGGTVSVAVVDDAGVTKAVGVSGGTPESDARIAEAAASAFAAAVVAADGRDRDERRAR